MFVYRKDNRDILRLKEVRDIIIVDIEYLVEYNKRRLERLKQIKSRLSEKEGITAVSNATVDLYKNILGEYIIYELYKEMGYRYRIIVNTGSSEYVCYTRKLGREDILEKIKNGEDINLLIVDEDEGFLEIK